MQNDADDLNMEALLDYRPEPLSPAALAERAEHRAQERARAILAWGESVGERASLRDKAQSAVASYLTELAPAERKAALDDLVARVQAHMS